MAPQQPASRALPSAKAKGFQRDSRRHQGYSTSTTPTRAMQTSPRYDLMTPTIALDSEFQLAKIDSTGKHIQRIGRISIMNYSGKIIFDAFAYYPETHGLTKTLPPSRLGLGVYWQDIQIGNGALPIAEVEQIVRAIVEDCIVVGHAVKNDFQVFSPKVCDGVKQCDTQVVSAYQQYATGARGLPNLSVLAKEVLRMDIQGQEHSSVEDAQATMLLYRHQEAEIEAMQGGDVYHARSDDVHDGTNSAFQHLYNQKIDEPPKVLPPLKEAEVAHGQRAAASFWGARSGAMKDNLMAETRKSNPAQER